MLKKNKRLTSNEVNDQPRTSWIYINKDTRTLIEYRNLHSLLLELVQVHDLNLPRTLDVDLLLNSRVDITVTDSYGDVHNIAIGEHSPDRNIYFNKENNLLN